MRAVYIDHDLNLSNIEINAEEKIHHLLNVVRIKCGEKILILNGNGFKRIYEVTEIQKRKIIVNSISDIQKQPQYSNISLLIGLVKKDDFSIILKSISEIGFKSIYISNTDYSQRYELNIDRIRSIIESSLEQSNNSIYPEINIVKNIKDIKYQNFDEVVLFNSQDNMKNEIKSNLDQNVLMVIGPEGGFSTDELAFYRDLNNCTEIKLQTPILRATTAISFGAGYLLANLANN